MKIISAHEVGRRFGRLVAHIKLHRFFRDRLSITILSLNLVLLALTLVTLIVRVRPSSVPVPIHYSSLVGFDRLGQWWQLYTIGIFAGLVIATNTTLAMASFSRSRITSFFLMSGAFVVAIFALIISIAMTAVV